MNDDGLTRLTPEMVQRMYQMLKRANFSPQLFEDKAVDAFRDLALRALESRSEVLEELKYLELSTRPDGQWADQAVNGFVLAMLASRAEPGAPSTDYARGLEDAAKVCDAEQMKQTDYDDGEKTIWCEVAKICAAAIRAKINAPGE